MLGNATDIPENIINKANSLNHNANNFVILQDINTGEYYLPYGSKVNNKYSSNWRYSYYNNVYCLITPGWGYTYMQAYINGAFTSVSTNNVGSNSIIQLDMGTRHLKVVYASQNVNYYNVTGHNNGDVYFNPIPNPFIENQDSDITSWNFSNLVINGGILENSTSYGQNYFTLKAIYNNTTYLLDIDNYKTIDNNIITFTIPKSDLLNGAYIRDTYSIDFSIIYYERVEGGNQISEFSLGSYTFSLTSNEQEVINQDNNQQLLGDIKQEQQQTTQAIENLDNTIKDTNIDNSSIYLPSDNTQDITQDGINNIFTSIYNAFCTGEAQDIIFPIPFTNKNITLQANYIRQMLTSSGANWVITIIEAFWWYLISRFIISDVSRKITKIKSGNVENIENNNIKEEML